ncbi:PREDICTED: uncharacterized protein LOC105363872 [Ceratosolen solmsi marchali]|uniref:Uncharacterized protein LOC105363872 n=1 Tax=Ceratosolen solmsi marchali TaxID=326594 RepID=A0AAJ6YKY5_9HYME|nr:PREDICTED: uncharacterized protein LOC105363872 [Ceratosolen solmsi marchali]
MGEKTKADLSNGFESRGKQHRSQQIHATNETNQSRQQQQQQHIEERSDSVPVLLTHQPYHDNIVIDRVQFLPQGTAQTIPVHAAQFAPEYIIAATGESLQYSQIHGNMYNPSQGQYVSRDLNLRDSNLYTQNVALAAAQGSYVQQVSQPQMSSTTGHYTNKGISLPPSVTAGYVHFAPQIHYNQYPQTIVNTTPYNSQQNIYPQPYNQQIQQSSSAQHSPNPQRFSQELTQYQGQPIIQPIAQNIGHALVSCNNERSCSRGPKPMVPPRGNSKITHESGHRKSASIDGPTGQKAKVAENNVSDEQQAAQQDLQHQQLCAGLDNQDKRYLVAINQIPRTRQDGLYVDANGESSRDQSVGNDTGNTDCGLYVSRMEHRKSASVDVTNSFSRRNDTLTFAFPCDNNIQQDSMLLTTRKSIASVNIGDNKAIDVNASNFPAEQRRFDVSSGLRVSPMPVLPPLTVVPKGILISGDRKSMEWTNMSPNQRIGIPQENRRSDYLDEHRRSPMTNDGKRFEEIRRSPMAFVPIRDTNTPDRINQKSPSNLTNQNFEKTRADLAMWKEQRQRQEIEGRIMQSREIFSTSPRSRNSSEERRTESRLSAFQPIANISQSSIMEQRRHLRHVSADLTKHMDLARKEFDEQQLTGSVINLGTTSTTTPVTNVVSQRSSPNVCYQYSALNDAKLDAKVALTIVTDFNDAPPKPYDNVDHIIHSHRKSQNLSATISKSQDNAQNHSEQANDKSEPQQSQCQQIMHNQQSIDLISEKLSQCERQQSDLQAKLQSLQNQNEILDKVTQFQYQQTDLQTRIHNLQLQNQIAEKLGQKHSSEFSQLSSHSDQDETNKSILNQCINASRHLYQQSLLTTANSQLQSSGYFSSERVSPRLQYQQQVQDESDLSNSIQIPNISQMPLPSLSQFDRADLLPRGSLSQLQRVQSSCDNNENIACSQMNMASLCTLNFTGTLKKIPPEKPPRTSLIVQSPDTESNRSQPAIGLKHTSKARRKERQPEMDDNEIQSTVESILGPDVKIIDCEKKSCVKEEEVLLINGVPITLDEPDGIAIREAMITGQVPPCDLLNRILIRAGIQRVPVRLETSLNVKSSVVTKEEVTVARDGKIVDERSRETKENNSYSSTTSEIWEPIGVIQRPRNLKPFDSSDDSRPNSNASSDQGYTTNTSSNNVLRERGGGNCGNGVNCDNGGNGGNGGNCGNCGNCGNGGNGGIGGGGSDGGNDGGGNGGLGTNGDVADCCLAGMSGLGLEDMHERSTKVHGVHNTTSAPTIFGTVASDLNPKDGNSRRELVYRDGNLVSGSLDALVQHMVPTEEYYPDRAYLFAFLLSARLFIKPHELLGEVCALCEHQQNLNGEGGKERLHRFVPRLVQLLAEWTETFPYDFRDERVMGHVRSITQKVANVDAAARQEVSVLLQNLLLKLTALERYEEALARLATEASTEQLTQVDVTELCPLATVLAQQLTHVELERLSYIGPEEFVQAFAKESPHLETSFKDMKKTRNLESYVQWFNRLSYFVATEVCKHAKKKQRVRVVEYWIETARECFNIGNFNSLMAIIAGLNMSPISRLKKTHFVRGVEISL